MENKTTKTERVFSIELNSRLNLKNLTLTNGNTDRVLVEGTLGELVCAGFVEGLLLELLGTKGTLRINLTPGELRKVPQTAAASDEGRQFPKVEQESEQEVEQ
jgi:hypothetical protein